MLCHAIMSKLWQETAGAFWIAVFRIVDMDALKPNSSFLAHLYISRVLCRYSRRTGRQLRLAFVSFVSAMGRQAKLYAYLRCAVVAGRYATYNTHVLVLADILMSAVKRET